ncbi:hypothetical protein EZV62_010702 [Acer yangbiense]|uniref:Transposase MuDR plant domain-containing protein n=1 Tax=Acer yangbiense TaxID=1000413 RepID=A0A5C7I3X7_9ROSI|nr:hypothetical protein EZV62_010702 [Acer yangbiense]
MPEPYNEDERSIPDYNPHSEYGLDDFDEDYIGHGGSCEGVNDELAHYHGMDSDTTEGGRSRSLPPVFVGPNRDTCEDDTINVGDRTDESSSCNHLSKGGMFQTKKGLKLALHSYALKENFEIRVTRSNLARYEVGCKDPECKFQFRATKLEG